MTKAGDLASQFKAAARRLAATVTIITSRDPITGLRCGMTATAVTSLSVDPPSLLVCVNQSASMHPTLTIGSGFCVNVLGEPHAELARAFGGQTEPELRFEGGEWSEDVRAVPFLSDAVAVISCEVDRVVAYATHSIIIGRVDAVRVDEVERSLVWANGQFALVAETH